VAEENIGKSTSARDLNKVQKETAGYIADIALELRDAARQAELSFLAHLLDMSFYEAYRLSHGAEPDLAEIERQRQIKETS
jgi:hypothetical protein